MTLKQIEEDLERKSLEDLRVQRDSLMEAMKTMIVICQIAIAKSLTDES